MFLEQKLYKKIMESMPIVCVDALIINEKKEYLLVKRKNEPLKNKFWMVGGRLQKNELTEEGIKRKLKEEVNIEAGLIKYLGHFEEFFNNTEQKINGNFHSISFVFLVFVNSKIKIDIDNQSLEYKWFIKLPKIFKTHIPWLNNKIILKL
jgi:colanic acid biosynthesis protein WcaH